MTNIIVHNEIPQVPPQASQSMLVDQVHQPRTFNAGRGSGEVLLSTHPIPLENQVSPSSLEVQVLPPPLPPSPSPIIVTSDDSKIYTPSELEELARRDEALMDDDDLSESSPILPPRELYAVDTLPVVDRLFEVTHHNILSVVPCM
jgi:hypothetical protein